MTGKNKHLNISQRIIIEVDLSYGKTFREIAREIGKDPSTVSYEIRRFVEWNGGECAKEPGNDCAHFFTCKLQHVCRFACDEDVNCKSVRNPIRTLKLQNIHNRATEIVNNELIYK